MTSFQMVMVGLARLFYPSGRRKCSNFYSGCYPFAFLHDRRSIESRSNGGSSTTSLKRSACLTTPSASPWLRPHPRGEDWGEPAWVDPHAGSCSTVSLWVRPPSQGRHWLLPPETRAGAVSVVNAQGRWRRLLPVGKDSPGNRVLKCRNKDKTDASCQCRSP